MAFPLSDRMAGLLSAFIIGKEYRYLRDKLDTCLPERSVKFTTIIYNFESLLIYGRLTYAGKILVLCDK
jgi:hypothetical protein